MRVADYIADFLYKQGVEDVFLLTGGGSMFLTDAVAAHPHLRGICTHHEQSAAMAAISYARYKNGLGATMITTGCGGTNTITGLLGAWQDSTPSIFISGQVKCKDTTNLASVKVRQLGVQELDIVEVVKSMTKYAVMVVEPNSIAYHLEKAVFLAQTGRPGPVWVDVPLDVQSAIIDESDLKHFSADEIIGDVKTEPSSEDLKSFISMFTEAKRPVVVAGQGVRLAKSQQELLSFVEKYNLPVVSPYLGVGTIPTVHNLFIGRIGTKGDRPGNFCVQNADLVIVLGSRLDVSAIGYNYEKFAREAKIIVVDIDPIEHKKNGVKIDLLINADVKLFLESLTNIDVQKRLEWSDKCIQWKMKWPICLPEYALEKRGVNLYYFIDRLSALMPSDAVVVSDAGSAFYVSSQAVQLKEGQRYITSGAQAEMGYTLPASIGISIARQKGEVLGITGDGSLQLNIQEFQTIVHHNLPVKTFVWNNGGYLSIRNTQTKFFGSRLIGTDNTSGVSLPNLEKIAHAYGIAYVKISGSEQVEENIQKVLSLKEPVICEVMCLPDQEIVPTVSSVKKEDGTMVSRPLEDMYPFLEREEFYKEMIVAPLEE